MPGQLYGRWNPPAKSTIDSYPKPSSPLLEFNQTRSIDSPSSSSRDVDRTSKKTKKSAVESAHPVLHIAQEKAEVIPQDGSQDIPNPPKKLKKRKRDANAEPQTIEEDEATPKKFKTILSKFERSMKLSTQENENKEPTPEEQNQKSIEEVQLHDLTPLPQLAPVPDAPFEPTYSTLPKWLAEPITVDSTTKVPFAKLGVDPAYVKRLEKQGFTEALAVQSVLLPMLHSGYSQHSGDICVSARTGSGKTLAYLLPVVEALKDRHLTTLSAIVIVPTRQLVDQAVRVAEELCAGTKLKVGTALGSVPFATEQKQLVNIQARYNSAYAKELQDNASQPLLNQDVEHQDLLTDILEMSADHVPEYESGVDILVCTPGRLVEHIESTTGFSLRSVRWLIIDEADQLLNQNFQGWVDILMAALYSETPDAFKNIQERLRQKRQRARSELENRQREITKIILSATMRKDLTKLGTLRLRRPKLVVVEDKIDEEPPSTTDNDVFELPTTIEEFGIPVDDGSNKPLYLLYLLLNYVFQKNTASTDSSSDESDSSSSSTKSIASHRSRVLIFVKSNENAARLSHLLSVLEPSLKALIRTKSPSSTAKQSQKLLQSFSSGSTKILIASDAASRGLDVPDITHVINYDMPRSITSYVHRIGRTARAGKTGQAWTMVAKNEAAWFWKAIGKGENIRRGKNRISRVEFNEKDVTWNRKRTYKEALSQLQGAVEGDTEVVG
ncbi:P-loop containing nucleoside triphosphate hydrolase protein [Dendryphion nanum]|uniref:ATP-dependent RNA helicase n=1 Tax=Dendryphion nanum TaxID=256645 RepID=A0A9P9IPL5_9PLEO|nr:P-loop containing nucleoside triphosphate hydrolase protein [Dendryphion nanum]